MRGRGKKGQIQYPIPPPYTFTHKRKSFQTPLRMPSAFVKSWELAVDRDSHGSTPYTRMFRLCRAVCPGIRSRCSRTRLVEKRTPVPMRRSHRSRVGPPFPYPKGP